MKLSHIFMALGGLVALNIAHGFVRDTFFTAPKPDKVLDVSYDARLCTAKGTLATGTAQIISTRAMTRSDMATALGILNRPKGILNTMFLAIAGNTEAGWVFHQNTLFEEGLERLVKAQTGHAVKFTTEVRVIPQDQPCSQRGTVLSLQPSGT